MSAAVQVICKDNKQFSKEIMNILMLKWWDFTT
jgi:hypothetical protein